MHLPLWSLVLLGMAALVGLFALPPLFALLYSAPKTYLPEDVPDRPVAIVFGAGLLSDGRPTRVLRDRVTTAANLYFEGKVQKLLMSGDNRFVDYNEPGSMRQFALELGVPDEDIVLDYAGRRTYDTCYRAGYIFGVRSAIVVTQAFHLPRAVMLCGSLGIDAVGVAANTQQYTRRTLIFWNLREIPATFVAFFEGWLFHPLPVLGKQEFIFKEWPVNKEN